MKSKVPPIFISGKLPINSTSRCALYNQLQQNGYMVFVTISKNDIAYSKDEEIAKDRFGTKHGINLFFYDPSSIKKEFGLYGLIDLTEIEEPAKSVGNKKFYTITCKKSSNILSGK